MALVLFSAHPIPVSSILENAYDEHTLRCTCVLHSENKLNSEFLWPLRDTYDEDVATATQKTHSQKD